MPEYDERDVQAQMEIVETKAYMKHITLIIDPMLVESQDRISQIDGLRASSYG